ncbi:MAG: copper chaperone PCu(A)C [Actinomycetia bacterium]|nr:copper chaperone PCu(A)C [Actinomycetes bacterium]MCP5033546.1 copper chaperone PCu(A)C [Actinomycetes bacterium]
MFKLTMLTRLSFGLLALVLGAAACGDGTTTTGGLESSGAWARTSPMNADAGAIYMTITADEAVSIVSASVPSDVAGRVEFHETVPVSEADGDTMAHDGEDDEGAMGEDGAMDDEGAMGEMAMTMQAVTTIEIAADGEAVLEPGGMHLMIFDLAEPLEAGQTFDLTLVTADGVELVVPIEVRNEAP